MIFAAKIQLLWELWICFFTKATGTPAYACVPVGGNGKDGLATPLLIGLLGLAFLVVVSSQKVHGLQHFVHVNKGSDAVEQ